MVHRASIRQPRSSRARPPCSGNAPGTGPKCPWQSGPGGSSGSQAEACRWRIYAKDREVTTSHARISRSCAAPEVTRIGRPSMDNLLPTQDTPSANATRSLSNLLLFTAALVFAMVVVCDNTRLTESGLSITEWKPISGAIPPLTQADWQHAFDLYRQTPQYRDVAGPAGMTLFGFKFIFFWE